MCKYPFSPMYGRLRISGGGLQEPSKPSLSHISARSMLAQLAACDIRFDSGLRASGLLHHSSGPSETSAEETDLEMLTRLSREDEQGATPDHTAPPTELLSRSMAILELVSFHRAVRDDKGQKVGAMIKLVRVFALQRQVHG